MKKSAVSCLLFVLLATTNVNAQRPSFAGSRPSDGLNQKDKYHINTTTTTTATATATATTINGLAPPANGVANRFGEAETGSEPSANTLPYGTPQRPPIFGPIVIPQPQYVPLAPLRPAPDQLPVPGTPSSLPLSPQFSIGNRVSGNDIGGNAQVPTAGIAPSVGFPGFIPPPQFSNVPPPPPPAAAANAPLPLDAHGDQELINYLNTLPLDQRPFWFLNYQAIEAQRNSTRPTFTGAVGGRGSFAG